MTNAPLKLVPLARRHQDGVRKTFKSMLRASREHGFVSVAIVGIDGAGFTHSAYEEGGDAVHLLGGIERVKARINRDLDDAE